MRRGKKAPILSAAGRAVALLLFTLCLFCAIPVAERQSAAKTTLGEIDAQIQALEDELKKATEAREKAAGAYQSVKDEYENVKKRKMAIDEELDAIDRQAETLRALAVGYREQENALAKRLEGMEKELDARLAVLRLRLRLDYENGGADWFSLLFSSDGLFDFLTSADRLSFLVKQDNELIGECEEACRQLADERERLAAVTADAARTEEELHASMTALKEKQDEVLSMMTKLEKDAATAERAKEEAEKEEDAFHDELEKKLEERNKLNSSEYGGGDFIWPLPAKYKKISSPFGERIHPVTGEPQFHKGVDIPAPNGTSVYCVAKGTVIETGNSYANGKYVIVDHGGGISTVYCHLSKIAVKKDDVLAQGEVLGLVGMTGWATGYHLHLTVYRDSKAVDPLTFYS